MSKSRVKLVMIPYQNNPGQSLWFFNHLSN